MAFVEQTTLYDYNPTIWRVTSTENLDFTPGYLAQLTAKTLLGQVTQIRPAPMPKAQSGFIEHSQYDDFYFRIHVIPTEINVGSLLNNRAMEVRVFNAFFEPHNLNSIVSRDNDGIVFIEHTQYPYKYNMLQEHVYDVLVTTTGPITIDAGYTFNFDVYPIQLKITGTRTTVFKWVPRKQFNENLEWNTDVIRTWAGEQRIALRDAPRQIFEYSFRKKRTEVQTIVDKMVEYQWGLPIWAQASRIYAPIAAGTNSINFDTTFSEYDPNGYAFIWQSDERNEAVGIANLRPDGIDINLGTSQSYENALIMPIKAALTPEGINFSRQGNNIFDFSASFLIVNTDNIANTNYPVYNGHEVITDGGFIVDNLSEYIVKENNLIDNGQGVVQLEATKKYTDKRRTLGRVVKGQKEIYKFRQWLYSKYGRQKAFWLPSFQNDVIVTSGIIYTTQSSMLIESAGLVNYGKFPIHCQIVMRDGTVYYKQITNAFTTENGEQIQLDSAFPVNIDSRNIKRLSFMDLVRFDTDRVTISYNDSNVARISIPVRRVV